MTPDIRTTTQLANLCCSNLFKEEHCQTSPLSGGGGERASEARAALNTL